MFTIRSLPCSLLLAPVARASSRRGKWPLGCVDTDVKTRCWRPARSRAGRKCASGKVLCFVDRGCVCGRLVSPPGGDRWRGGSALAVKCIEEVRGRYAITTNEGLKFVPTQRPRHLCGNTAAAFGPVLRRSLRARRRYCAPTSAIAALTRVMIPVTALLGYGALSSPPGGVQRVAMESLTSFTTMELHSCRPLYKKPFGLGRMVRSTPLRCWAQLRTCSSGSLNLGRQ